MKVLGFKTKIYHKELIISDEIKESLTELNEREVKVILLFEDESSHEDKSRKYILNKFLEGYDEEDRIYDNC